MKKPHGGNSRTARKRRERAALLSRRMRLGYGDAAFRLLQRRRALAGIAKYGNARVEQMNQAQRARREARLRGEAVAAELQRQEAQSTIRLNAAARAALRVRYGGGDIIAKYRDGECRPVIPGIACPACGWAWGSHEPHAIVIPYRW